MATRPFKREKVQNAGAQALAVLQLLVSKGVEFAVCGTSTCPTPDSQLRFSAAVAKRKREGCGFVGFQRQNRNPKAFAFDYSRRNR